MKWRLCGEAVRPDTHDRRSDGRFSAAEELILSFDDPSPQQVSAVLVDYSKSGFRAVHKYSALTTGQVVGFQRLAASGSARVVWNRIVGDHVETGFLVS